MKKLLHKFYIAALPILLASSAAFAQTAHRSSARRDVSSFHLVLFSSILLVALVQILSAWEKKKATGRWPIQVRFWILLPTFIILGAISIYLPFLLLPALFAFCLLLGVLFAVLVELDVRYRQDSVAAMVFKRFGIFLLLALFAIIACTSVHFLHKPEKLWVAIAIITATAFGWVLSPFIFTIEPKEVNQSLSGGE